MSILGARIKTLRKKMKLSQEQLAAALNAQYGFNIDRVMVSKWETGFQTPVMNTIIHLAKFFNVSIDFLNGNDDANSNSLSSNPTTCDSNSDISSTTNNANVLKIAGRDGSYIERTLTDDQLDLIKKMIDQLPNAEDL